MKAVLSYKEQGGDFTPVAMPAHIFAPFPKAGLAFKGPRICVGWGFVGKICLKTSASASAEPVASLP